MVNNIHSTKESIGGFFYPDVFIQDDEATEKKFQTGDILRIENTEWSFADTFFTFLLESGFLESAEKTYPNPRAKNTVPIWFLLASQFLLKLHNSHQYSHLETLLKSGSVLTKIGFNVAYNKIGFNKKNTKPRTTAIHHDTVRKFFLNTEHIYMQNWFVNRQKWFHKYKTFTDDGIFILDQTKIVVPKNKNYEDADFMPVDEFGHFIKGYNKMTDEQKKACPKRLCYSLSALLHVSSDRKTTHIASYKLGSGKEDELAQAKPTLEQFIFENPGTIKELIVDRGYIDGEMITWLKKTNKIDVLIPLKKSMLAYTDSLAISEIMTNNENKEPWVHVYFSNKVKKRPNKPSRIKKDIYGYMIKDPIEMWDNCKSTIYTTVFKNIMEYEDGSSEIKYWVLASTKQYKSAPEIYDQYSLRVTIEEEYRQQKLSWKIHKFTSPQKNLIEAQVAFTLLTYNLVQLYLRAGESHALTNQFIQTARQNEALGNNSVIIYAKNTFMVLSLNDYTIKILSLDTPIKEKILDLCKRQAQESHRSKVMPTRRSK